MRIGMQARKAYICIWLDRQLRHLAERVGPFPVICSSDISKVSLPTKPEKVLEDDVNRFVNRHNCAAERIKSVSFEEVVQVQRKWKSFTSPIEI